MPFVPFSSRWRAGVKRRVHDIQSTLNVEQHGRPPRGRDWLYAFTFLLLGALEPLANEVPRDERVWELLVLVPAIAAVPRRRTRRPYLLVIAVILLAIGSVVTTGTEFGFTGGTFLAFSMCAYAVARWRPPFEIALVGLFLLVVEPITEVIRTGLIEDAVGSFTLWAFFLGAGLIFRYRTVLLANRVDQARLTERNVLARELHDSVAHYVSAIAVQAQAAQYVARTNPAAAVDAMGEVERTANKAIDEMRRMVGALRTADDIARSVGSTSLLDLVDSSMAPQITVQGQHDLSELPPTVSAAVFRVAQESVTNARKHNRNATYIQVNCTVTANEVVLQVINDGVTSIGPGGGYGLIGMDERVRALGGEITAGPAPLRTWTVVARIPLKSPTVLAEEVA